MEQLPPETSLKTPEREMDALFRRKEERPAPVAASKHKWLINDKFVHAGICGLIIFFYIAILFTPLLKRFEYIFLDAFFRWRPPIETSSSIVYIEIAEDSIHKIGRWPWPRHYHAVAAHLLSQWGARAVMFDVLFSEPSEKFDDGALQEAIEKSGVTYLPTVLEGRLGEETWIHCMKQFLKNVRGTGHINISPDSDGTLRRVQPFLSKNGETHPHIALQLAHDLQGMDAPSPENVHFPKDDEGNIIINWAGKWRDTYIHYSFTDVLKSFEALQKGKKPIIKPEVFKNKICFIGLTAFGHSDIKATPFEPSYPGLGVHANLLNSILTQQMIRPVPVKINALCLLLVGVLATMFFVFFHDVRVFLIGLAAGFLWGGLGYFLFSKYGIWIYVVHPFLLIMTLYGVSIVFALILKNKEAGVLFSLATRDGLTGLYVIRHFRLLLNTAVKEMKLKNKPLSVFLMDIDHFKKINDTYGHPAGDAVLREAAKVIGTVKFAAKSSKHKVETCRYGGEEFMVMMTDCELEDAFHVANRLRMSVEEHIFEWEGLRIPVTLSMGVATLHEDETIPDSMVRRADVGLYIAKRQGRNRVIRETEIPKE